MAIKELKEGHLYFHESKVQGNLKYKSKIVFCEERNGELQVRQIHLPHKVKSPEYRFEQGSGFFTPVKLENYTDL